MSETRRPSAGTPAAPATPLPTPRPFKPHRGMFLLIGVVLFAWLAVLLTMYFVSIYPTRNHRVDYPGANPQTAP